MKNQSQHSSSSTPIPTSTQSQKQQLFVTAYGLKNRTRLCFPPNEGRTKQSHKDECDVNRIMARYMQTRVIDFVNKHQAQYGDVTAESYQDAMDKVARAKTMFHELPSKTRNRFQNDPAKFLDFVQNPANADEAVELGLMRPDYVTPAAQAAADLKAAAEALEAAKSNPGGEKP